MDATVGEPTDGPLGHPSALWTEQRRRHGTWTVLRRALWALASLCLLGLLCVRWLDLPVPTLVPVLQSGQPGYQTVAVLMAVVALGARLSRRRPGWYLAWVAPALAVCLLVAGQTTYRHLRAPDAPAHPVGRLTVLSANVLYGQADAGYLAGLVDDLEVDVLVVLEATPAFVERLDAAGLGTSHPYRAGEATDSSADGTVVLCRVRCSVVPGTERAEDGSEALTAFQQPAVLVDDGGGSGGPVLVRAVHPFPPVAPGNQAWRDALADLDTWQEGRPEERLVLAGDFNASVGHPGFRALLDDLDDAGEAAGRPLVRTWPHGRRVPPFVALDHVLTRGLAVADFETVRVSGTDHEAVLAELVW